MTPKRFPPVQKVLRLHAARLHQDVRHGSVGITFRNAGSRAHESAGSVHGLGRSHTGRQKHSRPRQPDIAGEEPNFPFCGRRLLIRAAARSSLASAPVRGLPSASHIQHMQKALTEMNLRLHTSSPTSPARLVCGSSARSSPASVTPRCWRACAISGATLVARFNQFERI
jgi:hypothetical protein